MKIIKEKRIRAVYVDNDIHKVAAKLLKTVTGKGTPGIKSSYRNICKISGRSRSVISGKSRMIWRKYADNGEIEGIRRASW